MTTVHPSSLIGAQAYTSQLRRQYSQEETDRAFSADDRRARRADRPERPTGVTGDQPAGEGKKQAVKAAYDALRNPTVGDVSPRPNPPARPLFSASKREAPNPNAQLRHTRPGTHLDITI